MRKSKYRAAASAGLLLAASGGVGESATTVQVSVGPVSTSTSFDVLFAQVNSVSQLVSISAGSVYTGEGADLTISAIFADNQVVEIFSEVNAPFSNLSLSDITDNDFTPFGSPAEVKGLRFTSVGGNVAGSFALPAATILTFMVVPEPTAALLAVFGMFLLAVRRRRMVA
jgi:hypothetical protein